MEDFNYNFNLIWLLFTNRFNISELAIIPLDNWKTIDLSIIYFLRAKLVFLYNLAIKFFHNFKNNFFQVNKIKNLNIPSPSFKILNKNYRSNFCSNSWSLMGTQFFHPEVRRCRDNLYHRRRNIAKRHLVIIIWTSLRNYHQWQLLKKVTWKYSRRIIT